jgi:hypothetical protein
MNKIQPPSNMANRKKFTDMLCCVELVGNLYHRLEHDWKEYFLII